MVTVSTLQQSPRTYHHGDLRSALVAAGLRALEAVDLEALSVRQLAREVGVSATAVYRHFPDKAALLHALAGAGLEQLGQYQLEAAERAGPSGAFSATGRAYVRWALANPALFRLIFSRAEPIGETVFGQSLAARLLQSSARAASGNDDARARQLVVQAWALVHGLAMLMLDGQLPPDEELIDRVIDPKTLFPA
ncbi:MAG: TetR/AcrR family transcriptional regulator [Novosphingobium sp.]|jgi:AcrR family transcriptional regulator|nr:TetR/AcrR family transcriptional regulator [Brevundimonas sp.]MCZ8323178.1 TetR/AcrR family transcriptional regulator [Novosphingobium sp.]